MKKDNGDHSRNNPKPIKISEIVGCCINTIIGNLDLSLNEQHETKKLFVDLLLTEIDN